jgi:hypothetical protein
VTTPNRRRVRPKGVRPTSKTGVVQAYDLKSDDAFLTVKPGVIKAYNITTARLDASSLIVTDSDVIFKGFPIRQTVAWELSTSTSLPPDLVSVLLGEPLPSPEPTIYKTPWLVRLGKRLSGVR